MRHKKERKKLSHENHKMEGLPEEILQEIVSLSEISPLKTLIACRTSEHNDSDWAVPFESDWPFDRCLGKRLDEGTVALANLNLDYFQTLRAWKAGTDRRTDNDEACGLLLLKDASAIYVFTDTTFYCYQRIGRMEKKFHQMRSNLKCVNHFFSKLDSNFVCTDFIFDDGRSIGPFEKINFFTETEISKKVREFARKFQETHSCKLEVIDTTVHTLVVRRPPGSTLLF